MSALGSGAATISCKIAELGLTTDELVKLPAASSSDRQAQTMARQAAWCALEGSINKGWVLQRIDVRGKDTLENRQGVAYFCFSARLLTDAQSRFDSAQALAVKLSRFPAGGHRKTG